VALCPWFELDDIVLFVIDDVNISNVEITRAEFSHELSSIEAVRVIDPTALFVEYRWLECTIREVSLGHCRVAMLVITLPFEECMLYFLVVNRCTHFVGAIWVCEGGIGAVVAVGASVALIAVAFDLIDVREGAVGTWTTVRVACGTAHVIVVNDALDVLLLATCCRFLCFNGLESFLAALAVQASVRIGTDAAAILMQLWKGVRVAVCGCFLGMLCFGFKAILSSDPVGVANVLCALRLERGAAERVATVVLWNLHSSCEVELQSERSLCFFLGCDWMDDV